MAVFWKIIRILAETSAAAECSLDNTHGRFCDKREHTHSTPEVPNRRQTLYFIPVGITKYPLLSASIQRFLVTLSPEMQAWKQRLMFKCFVFAPSYTRGLAAQPCCEYIY